MVSAMMPRVAAALARLSALLLPIKRATVSPAGGAEPGRKMVASLDRFGRISKFILNSVLSPSRRGVMRDFSSWGERGGGGGQYPGARATPAFQKVCFRTRGEWYEERPSPGHG
jgi:hypothetical protein